MKLKKLEIFGFKSFADKTTVEFGSGITIVVGPNGSGKSNIFDSVRWVLGEQSAKSLRGGKMEDVIFSGSDSRKTLGMAEVSLTMDNEDKAINLPYSEVKVTRRLYRSGESEYFINDNPSRLKDIVEIFMDTGVGIDSYSVISQGQVDRIIDAKPIERREIFEEAAGITKYIKRRDEALRKLESTELNMARINDILAEVKRQTAQLERQAKKAERYKELKLERDEMVMKTRKKDIKDKGRIYNGLIEKKDALDVKIHAEDERLAKYENELEEMKQKALFMEREINEKKEKWILKQEEIKRIEESLHFLTERKAELEQRVSDLRNENVENAGKIESINIEIQGKARLLEEKETAIKSMETQLLAATKEADDAAGEIEGFRRSTEEKRRLLDGMSEELSRVRNRITEQETLVKAAEEAIAKSAEERAAIDEKLRKAESELENIAMSRQLKEGEIRNIKEQEEALIKEKLRRKEGLVSVETALRDMELAAGRLAQRRGILLKMHEKMEGYGEIVRKVLTEYRSQVEDSSRDDIVGVVGNLISVEKAYEKAVEKTLAASLQAIVMKNSSHIAEILTLYEQEKGDISFISAGSGAPQAQQVLAEWKEKVKHRNITGYLPSVISAGAGNEHLKLLFYNIFTAPDMEKAAAVINEVRCAEQYFVLTPSGELLSNFGLFRKSAGAAGESEGFLSREREINEIAGELETVGGKIEALREEKMFREQKISEIEKGIEDLSKVYHNQYVEFIKDDERIKQREEDRKTLTDAASRADAERDSLIAEKKNAASAVETLLHERGRMETEIESTRAAIDSLISGARQAEDSVAAMKSALEAKRLDIMRVTGDFDMERNNKNMLEERLAEVRGYYENTSAEIEQLNARAAATDEESRAGRHKADALKATLSSDESALTAQKNEFEEFNKGLEKLAADIKEMGRDRERMREEQYDVKVRINEISVDIKAIYTKIEEEFRLTPPEEEINAFELGEEEYHELKLKVAENEEKIERMGYINIVAIEEYNELKKREDFLQAQYDDLNTARENLKKVIKKTNEESKELFEKAFIAIRKMFSEVFKKMMNGGEADLILTDRENILESGIDIIARPPGKKLQNITLLSGGEKAITAISLLFALFLTKASPFCIMDEIDAPLDDINVARFTTLLKTFNDKTQFIIISHNKITMETADVLYGVSMEKAGVSRIMSVKLDKAARMAEQIKAKKRMRLDDEPMESGEIPADAAGREDAQEAPAEEQPQADGETAAAEEPQAPAAEPAAQEEHQPAEAEKAPEQEPPGEDGEK